MKNSDVTLNDDGSVTVRPNEDEKNKAKKFADTRQTLAHAAKSVKCGMLSGGVTSVHAIYKGRALAIGVIALEFEEFWNKFRRRFPGTYWGYAIYGWDEESNIGRAVFVVLGPDDESLFSLIDEFGWLNGIYAVLDAFIETQDSFSGEPHPDDEF